MKFLYFIKINDTWRQVSHEEYSAFNGEKETRPAGWALQIVNALLLPYRYN